MDGFNVLELLTRVVSNAGTILWPSQSPNAIANEERISLSKEELNFDKIEYNRVLNALVDLSSQENGQNISSIGYDILTIISRYCVGHIATCCNMISTVESNKNINDNKHGICGKEMFVSNNDKIDNDYETKETIYIDRMTNKRYHGIKQISWSYNEKNYFMKISNAFCDNCTKNEFDKHRVCGCRLRRKKTQVMAENVLFKKAKQNKRGSRGFSRLPMAYCQSKWQDCSQCGRGTCGALKCRIRKCTVCDRLGCPKCIVVTKYGTIKDCNPPKYSGYEFGCRGSHCSPR